MVVSLDYENYDKSRGWLVVGMRLYNSVKGPYLHQL